jgi:hypothetical protein
MGERFWLSVFAAFFIAHDYLIFFQLLRLPIQLQMKKKSNDETSMISAIKKN